MFRNGCPAGCAGILLVFLALSPLASAQLAGGTISGIVTDPSGAVVPNAQVVIRNHATSVTRTLTSNDRGFFSAPNLPTGGYQVTVSAPGFNTVVQENLELTVGGEVVVNTQLKVGTTSESVEITAEPPPIELGSSMLQATVTAQTIRDLPLNGRDWTQLATLEPGVQTVNTQTAIIAGSNGRGNRGWGRELTVSGNRPQQNNYLLDGISINDYTGGGPGNVLGGNIGVDAIQEFSVVTSNASAEYAKTSGGVFNAVTRQGTNQFHGSLYEFLRNSALDARNFFDGATIPPFVRNQFGASAGGPIRKDRTFIFGDYEGLRQRLSTTSLITVPSRAARSGQLTSGTVTVDPKVVPFLAIFPLPNVAESGDTGTFSFIDKNVTSENFFTLRVDHRFSDKDSINSSYMNDNSQSTGPDNYNVILSALTSRRHVATLEESHLFSAQLANFARLGFSRVVSDAPQPLSVINPVATDTSLGFLPGRAVGNLTIAGISVFSGGVGALGEYQYHYNSYQARNDLFYTRQAHSLKFGFAVERIQANQFTNGSSTNGVFSFGSLKAFLTNQPRAFQAQIPGPVSPMDLRQTVAGAYTQDDWRARPNLTLNLGVRYEIATVPTEVGNRLSTLVHLTDAQQKLGSPYFQNPTLRDFSPRVGFSWDPLGNGRTAIRGGFGIYDALPLTYLFNLLTLLTSPFFTQGSVATTPPGSFPLGDFQLLTPTTSRVTYVEQNPKRAYLEQWNLNVQRQFRQDLIEVGYTGSHGVHQPFRTNDTNMVLPTVTAQGLLWPTPRGSGTTFNPNVGTIQALAWQESTSYNAAHLRMMQRMRHGFQIGGSYTWAKSIDTGSSSIIGSQFGGNSVGSLPLFWPKTRRGLSDFDIGHTLVVSYLWQLPSGHAANGILGLLARGWQVGGIFQVSSGQPFTVLVGGDPLGTNGASGFDTPNRVAGPGCNSLVNPADPLHYIKMQCFAPPSPGTLLGNGGRNTAIGPGLVNLDFSLFKETRVPISESSRIQFRAEFFNALNRANFNPPAAANAQVFDQNLQPVSGAGLLTSTSTTSRQIQFGLKLIW